MAGRRKGGKGSKRPRENWEERSGAVEREGKGQNDRGRIGRRGVGNGLQGRYCFLGFLRPPEKCKNPDWSDFMNYPIRRSNW